MIVSSSTPTLILELTAGLLILIISFLSTEIAIYFLIFSMLLSPEIVVASGGQREVSLRMDDILILVISLGWLARNAVYKELGVFVKTPLNRPILYYVIACIAATSIGIIFGKVNPQQGTFFVIKYIEYFAIFFIVLSNIHSREQIKWYLLAMFATAFVISIYAILQIPTTERVSAPFEGAGGEPNTLAAYLVIIISLLAGIFLSYKSMRIKAASIAFIVLAIIPFIYTLSRSSWMAIIAMCAAFIIFSRQKIYLLAFLLILLVFAPMIIPEKVEERYRATFMERPIESPTQVKIGEYYLDFSASARVISYKRILDDIKIHPIFGYGITGYGFIDGQYFRTLIETGLIGFAAFIYLLYMIFITLLKIYKNSSDELFKGISLGMLAGFAGLLAHALSANTFIIIRIMEPFWLVMAMVIAGAGITNTNLAKRSL